MIGGESLRFRRRRFGQIARVRAHTYARRTPPLDESHRENTNTHTHTQTNLQTYPHSRTVGRSRDRRRKHHKKKTTLRYIHCYTDKHTKTHIGTCILYSLVNFDTRSYSIRLRNGSHTHTDNNIN